MTARWRGHSHPELYKMINSGPGPGASDPQTQYWAGLTEELAAVDADLNKALSELKATWEGPASQNATGAMTPLQQWAGDAQTGSTVMRISSEDQADFISTARAEMPQPVEVTTPAPSAWDVATATGSAMLGNPAPAAMVALQAADHERQEAKQNAAAEKAVDTMNTYESSSTWNRNTLGTFVPPPDVVVDTPPPRGDTTVGGRIGAWAEGINSSYTTGNTTASGSYTVPGGGGSSQPGPGYGGPGASLPGGSGGSPGGGSTSPSQVAPPPAPPKQPPMLPGNGPGQLPPGGGGGNYPHGPGAGPILPGGGGPYPGGEPGGPNNTGGSRPGGLPGRGVPGAGGFGPEGGRGGAGGGTPGLGGPGGLDAEGRSAAQLGRGGMAGAGGFGPEGRGGAVGGAGGGARGAGMGGGPMGGGRGAGDEDDEHFAPDYLLETTDVFGDERMVSPAVIGEDLSTEEK